MSKKNKKKATTEATKFVDPSESKAASGVWSLIRGIGQWFGAGPLIDNLIDAVYKFSSGQTTEDNANNRINQIIQDYMEDLSKAKQQYDTRIGELEYPDSSQISALQTKLSSILNTNTSPTTRQKVAQEINANRDKLAKLEKEYNATLKRYDQESRKAEQEYNKIAATIEDTRQTRMTDASYYRMADTAERLGQGSKLKDSDAVQYLQGQVDNYISDFQNKVEQEVK